MPCDIAAYAQIDTAKWHDTYQVEPRSYAMPPGFDGSYERHLAEHPLVTYYLRHRDDPVLKLSDFLTRRQYHDLGLYREAYRQVTAVILAMRRRTVAKHVERIHRKLGAETRGAAAARAFAVAGGAGLASRIRRAANRLASFLDTTGPARVN